MREDFVLRVDHDRAVKDAEKRGETTGMFRNDAHAIYMGMLGFFTGLLTGFLALAWAVWVLVK